MKKKIAVFLLAFVLAFSVFGCKKAATRSIIMSESEIEIELYDTHTLSARADNVTNETFDWSSSNESVATVKDGVVTAVGVGKADITAKSGKESAKCTVSVIENSNVPNFSLRESLSLAAGSSFTVTPSLTFKGEAIDLPECDWSTGDSSVATVSAGRITAVAEGETDITATATAFGEILSASVRVTVKRDAALILADETVTLYTPQSGLAHEYDIEYAAIGESGALSGSASFVSSDEKVVTVSGDKVTAVGKGSAVITANGTFGGIPMSASMRVTVTVPTRVMQNEIVDFDTKTGDASEIGEVLGFAAGEEIERVSAKTESGTEEYEYLAGNKTIVRNGAWKVGETRWLIETSGAIYDVKTVIATRVLKTKEDIISMRRYDAEVMNEPDYYVLAQDIDMEFTIVKPIYTNGDFTGTYSWLGTFDGRGHAIKHFNALTWDTSAGFFGCIGRDSVVKNLAFTDAAPDGAFGTFASYIFGRVENIYMSYDKVKIGGPARTTGLLALQAMADSVIKNVIVDYGDFTRWAGRDQGAFIDVVNTGANISDCYAYYKCVEDGLTDDERAALVKMFKTVQPQAQVDEATVKAYADLGSFKASYFADFDSSIWNIPAADGVLPTFRAV